MCGASRVRAVKDGDVVVAVDMVEGAGRRVNVHQRFQLHHIKRGHTQGDGLYLKDRN
jgi:hypothetical protein